MSVLTQFLSNRSQYVLVDGCRSKLVNVVSGVPLGSAFGPLLFLLYTSELFSILEDKLIGCADDSTLMAVVPSPGARVTEPYGGIHVAESETIENEFNSYAPGYTRYFDRTSVYFCTSPLQNLAVPQDFYSPLSISLERSG